MKYCVGCNQCNIIVFSCGRMCHEMYSRVELMVFKHFSMFNDFCQFEC